MIVLGLIWTLAGILLWSMSMFVVFLTVLLVGLVWKLPRPGRHRRRTRSSRWRPSSRLDRFALASVRWPYRVDEL